ncbi:hypothetical protein SAMN05661080_01034 [Modestobacter sp. DSM 44400]|uniref:ExeM/NucH family extracellular endonuclease n=1 Tax=Modestobacter sp. DSM 44400 TaxID=1550230 RepID=UPI0008958370|nr:ExeM/NucH family extracellular endonuclease [Modestobacter sp. DSM 44400]SDX74772.1 hypothetical protein SAMN05661080_01034 [Modestobacter sp. DSM 44400]
MSVRPGRTRSLARRAAIGSAAVSLAVLAVPAVASAAPPGTPFLSELHYDNADTDTGEFVEVQLPHGTTSTGLSVVLYNGSGGAPYATLPLPVVTALAGGAAVVTVDGPTAGIQNGAPDGLALVRGSEVLEFLSYEGAFAATAGPAAGRTSTDIRVTEGSSTQAGQSLSRGYSAAIDAFVWGGPAAATPGEVNPDVAPPSEEPVTAACDTTPTHEIGAVQGAGAQTPLAGQQVTVRGVVVGDEPGLSGFYLQDADGDGDTATSDGVFVYSPVAVDRGDTVGVTGEALEFGGQTQIVSSNDVQVCTDLPLVQLPAPALLDLPADDADRERLEGMLVSPVDALTVSEVFGLTRFGELVLSQGGVLVQPTEAARPGTPEATAVAADNALRSITLDDGASAGTSVKSRPYLSPMTPVRVGDELTFTEPLVLGFGFGTYRLQPADGTAAGVFTPQNTRTVAPEQVGGDVQLGAFNVLNYFLTSGGEGRGARNQAQLEKQAGKIVPAIEALGADVVTLMEIEDTDSTGYAPGNADAALAELVGRLDAAAGYDKWSYVPLPAELYAVDRDVIRSGIIYQQGVVQPVGAPAGLVDETVWSNAREPIAQTFAKDGDAFTVVANHFKSKGGDGTGDNADDTGQGSYNGDRVRQAASLAAFTETLRAQSGDPDVVLMGDFNAYSQEDPIEELRTAGYTDLGEEFDAGRYSYVFDALSGSLDHALATAELTAKITDVAHWNINSVESFAYQYTGDPALYAADPYRSSDHDPLVIGIDLAERCHGLVPTIRGTAGDDVLRGGNGVDVIMGLGGDDTITGGNADDVICGGAGDDTIAGDNGDDVLLGGFGEDVVRGENGSDTLIGGPGTDVLDQGLGTGPVEPEGPES